MQTYAFDGYLLTSALPGPVLGTHTARNEPGPVPDLTEPMPQCVLGVWDTQFQANSGNTQQISIFMASKQDAGIPRRPTGQPSLQQRSLGLESGMVPHVPI